MPIKKSNSQRLLSGGQAIVESLKVEGVKHVFGLIGSATMELFDALYSTNKIKFIGVRDERTGTHMADGYARASGKPGIIIAGQNGPGATNLVTGVAQASAAFSPVISLAGAITSEHVGKDAFQEVDQQALFEPITKKTWTINHTKKIPMVVRNAFKLALKPKCGPVHINLPRDVLATKKIFNKFAKHKKDKLPQASSKDLLKVIKFIKNSSKLVIIAGGGVKNSNTYKKIIFLAKKINSPIVSSAGHGDNIRYDQALYAGQMGPRGNKVASKLVKNADLILAIGTRLGFNSTFFSYDNINKFAKIIQVDIEKISLGRYFPVTLAVHSDAKFFINQLCKKLSAYKHFNKTKIWVENFKEEKKLYLIQRDKDAKINNHPIHPKAIFKILRETLPSNTLITLDAGTLCLQATDMLNYSKAPSFFTPLDFGLVGFSFACGLGVKLANPKKPVVSLMGDGGFGMTISELSTAVEYKINTIVIVMNNNSWGAEKAYQRDFYNKRYIGADIKSPPFEKIAKLYGAKGYLVNKISELKSTVKSALKCQKPVIINIKVDPKALYSFRRDSFKHKNIKI